METRAYGHIKTDQRINEARERYKLYGSFLVVAPYFIEPIDSVILYATRKGDKVDMVFITTEELNTQVNYNTVYYATSDLEGKTFYGEDIKVVTHDIANFEKSLANALAL